MVRVSSHRGQSRSWPMILSRCINPKSLVAFSVVALVALVSIHPKPLQTGGQARGFMTRGGNDAAMNLAQQQCRFFLAESAIPKSGLGIFSAVDIPKGGETQSMPDVCIYVADTPEGTDFDTHSWARDVFLGAFEGAHSRGACEGVATLVNTLPNEVNTAELVPFEVHTNAGLRRDRNPGAGAVTHYYGVTSKARRDVAAGDEITIDYGDWKYSSRIKYKTTSRTPEWLRKHGMCIDHIDIRQAIDPEMGRGAFARRFLPKGVPVAPAPLQTFQNRADFAQQKPEALFVNYCFQPSGSDILLFPYGPGVNLINHSSKMANVGLRWSPSAQNHLQWLDLPLENFWEMVYPGALILEVYALRDIGQDEELFLDYGSEWNAAWEQHVRTWKPNKEPYVYEADMDLTKRFRTLKEQEQKPYPANLATVCHQGDWEIDEGEPVDWSEPEYWAEAMAYAHILKREKDPETGSYVYEVSMGFRHRAPHELDDKRFIVKKVPHRALGFTDRRYQSDMHLKNSFRHPIGIPDHLIPEHWRTVKS